MKVAELRAQGWNAIQGDVLTNGLSDRIVLSEGGAIAVNEGHHDELEIVDLLWRNDNDQECEFSGITDHSLDGWRPYFGRPYNADEQLNFVDNETANATVKAHIESMRPMFTQAMADAGELPPINAECDICYENDGLFFKGSVIAYFEDLLWLDLGGKNPVRMTREVKFKPLDNRTEKQKAVDIANKEFLVDKPTLEAIYDLWAQKIEQ